MSEQHSYPQNTSLKDPRDDSHMIKGLEYREDVLEKSTSFPSIFVALVLLCMIWHCYAEESHF